MTRKGYVMTSIDFKPVQHQALKVLCAQQNIPMSEVVRNGIDQYLVNNIEGYIKQNKESIKKFKNIVEALSEV